MSPSPWAYSTPPPRRTSLSAHSNLTTTVRQHVRREPRPRPREKAKWTRTTHAGWGNDSGVSGVRSVSRCKTWRPSRSTSSRPPCSARTSSVPRLQRLAEFYGVPVDQLLPRQDRPIEPPAPPTPDASTGGITIDLSRLHGLSDPELDILERFLASIQVQRQDFNGKMLTIRREDLRVLACLFDVTPNSLADRLDDMGLKVGAEPR